MPSPSSVLLRTQTDERLVALVRAGHDRAFDAIVERYRKPLLRACMRILPEARAEDALQQALVAAWKGLERGDEVHELRPWLYRIARNTALNQLRVAGYDLDELVETLSAAHDPEEVVLRRAVVRQTLAAVAALPERQREALLRTAVEGRGQDEVARDLGLSDTAVRALVHRARVRVRAAATAVIPLPVAAWAASAGGTGAAVTLAKAGTLAVLAGGAVTAPTLIHEHGGVRPAVSGVHKADVAPQARGAARPTPAHPARTVFVTRTPTPVPSPARPARARPTAPEDHRGPGPGTPERDHDRSGPGGGDRHGGEADEPVVEHDHSGSGSEGGETPEPVTVPTPTATPTEGHEGHGGGGGDTEPLEESHEGPGSSDDGHR